MSKIEVNEIDKTSGSTLTLGGSGTAVTLACGATQSGFGRTGTVDWQTGDIKTGNFTATNGEGYFVNTTSGGITVNLPAGVAGAIVGLKDYAGTWDDNAVTLNPNGSDKIGGGTTIDVTLSAEGGSVLLVFVDSTQGWLTTQQSVTTSPSGAATFNSATGGNTTITCGNFKTHIFTSPGTFTVCSVGSFQDGKVEYLVVAGGGGGGSSDNPISSAAETGGAGAGGFRSFICGSPNPLNAPAGLAVTATSFPIAVGGGGAGKTSPPGNTGGCGSASTFHTIQSAGGAGGTTGFTPSAFNGLNGGSGSGGGACSPGSPGTTGAGTGNTPPVAPPQGNNGGTGQHVPGNWAAGGGGGGAGGVGANASNPGTPGIGQGGCGGAGSFIPTAVIGPTAPSYGEPGPAGRYFAGGGGGGSMFSSPTAGLGGLGGGGDGASGPPGAARQGGAGVTNTGGGAGGQGRSSPNATTGNGGSGIVIIRYRFQ
jgi:hypothetical protein